MNATATGLTDGTVLVAAGYAGPATTAIVERYHPASRTFAAAGSLLGARASHTATLLPGGKVLVAGGEGNGSTTLATVELYDPARAVLGRDRVHAPGPRGPHGDAAAEREGARGRRRPYQGNAVALAAAELYDPATGSFVATGSLREARYAHTATLLPNGKVLIAGGYDPGRIAANGGLLASAEIYRSRPGDVRAGGDDGHAAGIPRRGAAPRRRRPGHRRAQGLVRWSRVRRLLRDLPLTAVPLGACRPGLLMGRAAGAAPLHLRPGGQPRPSPRRRGLGRIPFGAGTQEGEPGRSTGHADRIRRAPGAPAEAHVPRPGRRGDSPGAASRRKGTDDGGRHHDIGAHLHVLRAVRLALRRDRHRRGGALRPPRSRPVAPHGPGALREGPCRARTRLSPRPPEIPVEADASQGRSRPGLAADRLGRSAAAHRVAAPRARSGVRARERGLQPGLALDLGVGRLDGLGRTADARLRQPEPRQRDGAVRLGPSLRDGLHVRSACAWTVPARPRERRLHPPLGLQPQPREAQPRDCDHRGAEARGTPHRGRSPAHRAGSAGRRVVAGAPGHRRRARPGACRCDDRAWLVRRAVPA